MWKNLGAAILLLLISSSCQSVSGTAGSGVQKVEIQGQTLAYTFNDGAQLDFALREGDWLSYQLKTPGELPLWSTLWISSTQTLGTWISEGNTYRNGDWSVNSFGTGVQILKNDRIVTLLSANFDGEVLRMVVNAGTGENWFGLGGITDDPQLAPGGRMLLQQASYGDQTYLFIPWVFTNKGDGFYFNAHGADEVEVGKSESGVLEIATLRGVVDGRLRHDDSVKKLTSEFYHWSGSQSLLPRWAYGFLQSKYGYKNTKEVLDLVAGFETRDIPLSGVVLDLYWFKHMGDYSWDLIKWNPKLLDEALESRGIKTIAITEPYFTSDSRLYKDLEVAGALVGDEFGNVQKWNSWWCFGSPDGSIVNPLNPGAQKILGQAYKDMKTSGIDGFWTDLGEPEENPDAGVYNGINSVQFHNYYNFYWNKILRTALAEQDATHRPFILSRSGFTGSAGLGVSVWSGDVSSTFESLAKHPALGLTAGLTGFSYWGSDVGGFISRGLPDKELFVRWHQFGAFSPVYRAHGAQSPREPWIHGEPTAKIVGDLIRLRSQLLPYIYTTAWQTWNDGIPMMRPLWFETPEEKSSWGQTSSYFFGDNLFLHPVTAPGVKTVEFWLPPGTWFDWFNGQSWEGGKIVTFPVTLETFPLLVKAGSIIPTEVKGKKTFLVYQKDNLAQGLLYEDDGVSEAFRTGIQARVLEFKDGVLKVDGNIAPEDWSVVVQK